MKPEIVERAERVLGSPAQSWARVASRGYSLNDHWTVVLEDGTRAFVKVGNVDPSPQWVRDEHRVFTAVAGPFMPRLLAFEDGERPLLALQDLMPARWPPPWRPGDVDAVRATLAEVASADVHGELPRLAEIPRLGWHAVADDPQRFLSLGLASADWLERALPALIDAQDRTPLDGESLVHSDVRSDNLCLRDDGRAVLVDWNHASIGNPAFDVAFWLPSLALEHGPPPESFGLDEFAPYVAGFFAELAGLPPPDGAPRVRAFQLAQLEVALPWASRALGLPL
jgi:Phosphotransferase enzyme family